MHYYKHVKIIIFSATFGVFLLALSTQLTIDNPAYSQTTATTCANAQIMNTYPTGTNVSGIMNIEVYVSPGSTQGTVNKMILLANNAPIGRAVQTTANTYTWRMPWVTSLSPNGTKSLVAQVYFNDSSSCLTNPYSVNIINPAASQLVTQVTPQSWTGPMSANFAINTNTIVNYPAFDPSPYSLVNWSTTIGYLTPAQKSAQFSSGSTVSDGAVTIRVQYGGATTITNIPMSVKAPDAPLPTTESTTTTTTTSGSSTPSTQTTQTTATPLVGTTTLQNNASAQDCVTTAIGGDRFQQINTGQVRPTPEEVQKINICFASSKYIVPSNFAPIAPTEAKTLAPTKNIAISTLKNESKNTETTTKEILKINGKSTPNSIVFIYIFSDPIVLTTTADNQGNWEYVLEDPLEPGSHEVYAVVNKGDGVYERSEPFSFLIGTAEAAEVNPSGLNLKLVGNATPAQSQKGLIYYMAGSLSILLVVIVLFIVTIKNRSKNNSFAYNTTPVSNDMPNPQKTDAQEPIESNVNYAGSVIEPNTPTDNSDTKTNNT